MNTIKDLIESGDEEFQLLVEEFTSGNMGWDEFYAKATEYLHSVGSDKTLDDDYERAMKGI